MPDYTLLLVHGTGVRNAGYSVTLAQVRDKVREFALPCRVEPLLWSDVHGVDFEGKSLPEPCARSEEEEAQALRWEYLQIDPLFDLKLWCGPGAARPKRLGESDGRELWEDKISAYTPGAEFDALLRLNGLERLFGPAWDRVVGSGLPETAFDAAGDESAAVSRVFAEAIIAQMAQDAAAEGVAIPSGLRKRMVERLIFDWGQMGKGIRDVLLQVFGKATKQVIRPLRSGASRLVAPALGDILHYLQGNNGKALRELIRDKIAIENNKVFVLSHSLGGIACFETMVESKPHANVAGLITAGSQAPLLHEFGALSTMGAGPGLPAHFPPWLNLYDENDLLSYRADPVFDCKADKQVDSMLPPLSAHSGYWKLDETWIAIRDFMKQHG